MTPMTRANVLLVDDHRIMRDGLRALLERQDGISVVGEAADGPSALALARTLRPDVVILDISLPGLSGIEVATRIAAELPYTRTVALSKHDDHRFVARMIKAGASAYLIKDCAFDELTAAIGTVMRGRKYLGSGIAGTVIDLLQGVEEPESALSALTDREREVFQLLAEGRTAKEIAATLSVSVKTVDTHRQHVMAKLEVTSVAELARIAIREGVVPLDD